MAKRAELAGKVFGHLTVLKDDGTRIQTSIAWLCRCDCGKLVHVRSSELTSGRVTSCGHVKREKIKEVSKADLAKEPGTRLSLLTGKPNKGNTTGERNVSIAMRHGDKYYRVFMMYKGKRYGSYHKTLDEATQERDELQRRLWPHKNNPDL